MELVKKSFSYLKKNDMVLGPSEDGGYYLIALNTVHKEIFENIEWSTNRVLDQTLHKARMLNLKWNLLSQKNDIDQIQDLNKLFKDLRKNRKKAIDFPENVWLFLNNFFGEK